MSRQSTFIWSRILIRSISILRNACANRVTSGISSSASRRGETCVFFCFCPNQELLVRVLGGRLLPSCCCCCCCCCSWCCLLLDKDGILFCKLVSKSAASLQIQQCESKHESSNNINKDGAHYLYKYDWSRTFFFSIFSLDTISERALKSCTSMP